MCTFQLGSILPLDDIKKHQIKDVLKQKIREKIDEFAEAEDMCKPFYVNLFSKEIVFSASLLQSIYTWLGGKWEEIAAIAATGNFPRVERRYKLNGKITSKEQATIDNILKDLEQGRRNITIDMVKEELSSCLEASDHSRETSETIDLYIENGEMECYIELKSVKPNKNEMRAAKRDLLDILAMRQKVKNLQNVHVYLALPFNPYFRGHYRRWTVTKFFRAGQDLLVGEEFWDLLGGEGTYKQLLGIFKDVGSETMNSVKETIERMERGTATLDTYQGV